MVSDLAENKGTKIVAPAKGGGTPAQTSKRYRITVAKAGAGTRFRRSVQTFDVDYASMSARMRNVQKAGGKVVSISVVS